MYTTIVNLLVLAVGVAAAPAVTTPSTSTTTCNEDNCLRAVQGSAFPTRHGSADCASYFLTTVTPATSTQTVTVTTSPTTTVTATITNTGTVTDVATITDTATITDVATITDTATAVDTITDIITVPVTETITAGVPAPPLPTIPAKAKRALNGDLRGHSVTLAPRQMTVAPSSIPSYASACSGSARYSSACSCIGVTKSTTTAPTPVTTKTVTATAVQTNVVTQTSSATATDLVTLTSLATATDLITQTSIVTATVDVTATALDTITVATVTAVACGPTPTILLQAVGGGAGVNGQYAQLVNANDGQDDEVIIFTSSASAATPFRIDAAGHLNYGGYYANIDSGVQHFLFYFDTPATIADSGYVYATCSVLPTGMLSCVDQTSTMFQISPSVAATGEAGAGVVIGAYIEAGNTPFSFQATCVG
ncbi:hypothetical protein MMC17_006248 [Xylographa soralifera]|nr:hypothetical protein [Xylographa soralifera]